MINTSVAGYPHPVAIYAPSNATRAIVVLHGGGGNNTSVANQLAMNTSSTVATLDTVNWTWLDANQVMLVLPQGQHIDTASAPTWSNYAMTSGQDDKGLLQALSANLRATYGFTHITLMGHSMGGTMTNRMWCESPTTFNAYVSLAGPASSQFQQTSTPCACVLGAATPPYMGIIGDSDSVMQTSGNWTNTNWYINPVVAGSAGFLNSTMIGEWYQQGSRVSQVCGGTVDLNAYSNAGNVDTWTSCGGKLVLKRVLGADHGVDKIAAQMNPANPTVVMDAVMAFVKAQ